MCKRRGLATLFGNDDGSMGHEGKRNVILFAATVVAGVWTVHEFISTSEATRANAELTKLQDENEHAAQATIKVSYERVGPHIKVVADVVNPGPKTLTYNFEDWPAFILRRRSDDDGGWSDVETLYPMRFGRLEEIKEKPEEEKKLVFKIEEPPKPWVSSTIEPKGSQRHTAIHWNPKPGVWQVQFIVPKQVKDAKRSAESNENMEIRKRPAYWFGDEIYVVEEPKSPK